MNAPTIAPEDAAARAKRLADSTISQAKRFAENYDGPVRFIDRTFGAQPIKQIIKRDSDMVARNLIFLEFFARTKRELGKLPDECEAHLKEKIDTIEKKFKAKIGQAKTVLDNAGEGDEEMATESQPLDIRLRITSPFFDRYIKILLLGDQVINSIDTLWLFGHLSGDRHSDERFAVKKEIRGLIAFIRQLWIGMQKQIQKSKAVGDVDDTVLEGTDEVAHETQEVQSVDSHPATSMLPQAEPETLTV